MKIVKISWEEFRKDCEILRSKIDKKHIAVFYGIPKNGLYVAQMLGQICLFDPQPNHIIVDDLIDSGKTLSQYPKHKKAVLYVKNNKEKLVDFYVRKVDGWIQMPWETDDEVERSIARQLQYIGEDISRDGLQDTPKRILKSWNHLFSGYQKNPKDLITTFEKGSYDQMVVLKDIEFYSTCEHHFQPFFGKAHIAYIPNKKVIGISKLARILEVFTRRLQIQERIGEQVTDFLMKELGAKGAGCILEAKHFCMVARGVEKQNSVMVTSSIKGNFREHKIKSEFLNLCENK
jgi:GTP cyclohydrolase I